MKQSQVVLSEKGSDTKNPLHVVQMLCTCFMFVILLIVVILDRRVHTFLSEVNKPLLDNLTLLIPIILVGLIVSFVFLRFRSRRSDGTVPSISPKQVERQVLLLCLGIALAQFLVSVWILSHAESFAGWDVGVLTGSAWGYVHGDANATSFAGVYLSFYPNNKFLFKLLVLLARVTDGAMDDVTFRFFLSVVTCGLVSISCFLTSRVIHKVIGKKVATIGGLCLMTLLVGLSPWFMVFYSDTIGLFLVSLCMWEQTCIGRRGLRWFVLSATAVLGYFIKPTVVLFLLAVILVEAIKVLSTRRSGCMRGHLRSILCIVLGATLSFGACTVFSRCPGLSLDPEKSMPMSHFAMMGLNYETDGVYSQQDVSLSQDMSTLAERKSMNWRVVLIRLKAYGPLDFMKHEVRKALIAFDDGTFAWCVDGNPSISPQNSPGIVSTFLQGYYYPSGAYYGIFCTVQQVFWLLTLVGISCGLFGLIGTRRGGTETTSEVVTIALVSIVLLALFLLVFEVRARYLYLYGGCFILAAVWGLQAVERRLALVGERIVSRTSSKPHPRHERPHKRNC